jgi:hypothetical protein
MEVRAAGRLARAARAGERLHLRTFLITSVAVGLYLVWFRTHTLTENFALLDDQIRDWRGEQYLLMQI